MEWLRRFSVCFVQIANDVVGRDKVLNIPRRNAQWLALPFVYRHGVEVIGHAKSFSATHDFTQHGFNGISMRSIDLLGVAPELKQLLEKSLTMRFVVVET